MLRKSCIIAGLILVFLTACAPNSDNRVLPTLVLVPNNSIAALQATATPADAPLATSTVSESPETAPEAATIVSEITPQVEAAVSETASQSAFDAATLERQAWLSQSELAQAEVSETTVLVEIAAGTEAEFTADVNALGGSVLQLQGGNYVVNIAPEQRAAVVNNPSVQASEADFVVQALTDMSEQQWNLPMIGLGTAVFAEIAQPAHVTVAVIDSGICPSAEFAGRILAGYDYVDADTEPMDVYGHGCAVTSVLGAANNGDSILGVNPYVNIMPMRILDAVGHGLSSNLIRAIYDATAAGADVILMSLGTSATNTSLEAAVNYAIAQGVVLVAAAGNGGSNAAAIYPAAYAGVLSVGSVDATETISTFSNPADVYAPGQDILALRPDGSIGRLSGSSLAAPHVAGLVALSLGLSGTVPEYAAGAIARYQDSTTVLLGEASPIPPTPQLSLTPLVPTTTAAGLEGTIIEYLNSSHINAEIHLTGESLDLSTNTNNGVFAFNNLDFAGEAILVNLEVHADGFGTWTMNNIVIYAQDTSHVNVILRPEAQHYEGAGIPAHDTIHAAYQSIDLATPDVFSAAYAYNNIPTSIRVAITGYADCGYWSNNQYILYPIIRVDTINFRDYVKGVLPHEWISSWNGNALRAGAVAVKMYSWWKINIGPRGYWNNQAYDVRADTCDQVYSPTTYASTNAAVDETWQYVLHRSQQVVEIHYADTDTTCSRADLSPCMAQWGSKSLADSGYGWQDILSHYYGLTLEYLALNPAPPANQELLRNNSFQSNNSYWSQWGDFLSLNIAGGTAYWTRRAASTNAAVLFQAMPYNVATNMPLEAIVVLGNGSPVPKTVMVALRDPNGAWGAGTALTCNFTIPAYSSARPYVLRGRSGGNWPSLQLEVGLLSADGQASLHMEWASTKYLPALSLSGTQCIAPTASVSGLVSITAPSATSNDTSPLITYSAVTNAVAYRVQISSTNTFTSLIADEVVLGLSYTSPTLSNNAVFYLRVKPLGVNDGAWTVKSFTLDTVPPTAALITAPSTGAILTNQQPTVTWTGTAARFELYLGSRLVYAGVNKTAVLPFLVAGQSYSLVVRSYDTAGNLALSPTRSFTVNSPAKDTVLVPVFRSATPTLSWNPLLWSANNVEVQVATSATFSTSSIVFSRTLQGLSVTMPSITEGLFFIRVRGVTASRLGTWAVSNFIVDLP